ncbi:hypothetical protein RJG79_01765 [Mycoplasmatota bacterium WC44]
MNKKRNNVLIYLTIILPGIIGILFSFGYLLTIFSDRLAFPIIFSCLGLQQLLYGLFSKKSNTAKIIAVIFGLLFIFFAVFVVIPTYYY